MHVTLFLLLCFSLNRNLNVAEDNDLGDKAGDDDGDIVAGLHCKIVVQFERYKDFYNALKVLCGCSLQKVNNSLPFASFPECLFQFISHWPYFFCCHNK